MIAILLSSIYSPWYQFIRKSKERKGERTCCRPFLVWASRDSKQRLAPESISQVYKVHCWASIIGKKLPTIKKGLRASVRLVERGRSGVGRVLHAMFIATDGKGKAASHLRMGLSIFIGAFERATCHDGFMSAVESNRAKLLPVADERIFADDLMDGQFPLQMASQLMKLGRRN
jgi:hypothetical protein